MAQQHNSRSTQLAGPAASRFSLQFAVSVLAQPTARTCEWKLLRARVCSLLALFNPPRCGRRRLVQGLLAGPAKCLAARNSRGKQPARLGSARPERR